MNIKTGEAILLVCLVVVASIYYGVKENMGKILILAALIAAMYWHENIANFFASPPQPTVSKPVVVGAPHTNNPPVMSSGAMGASAPAATAPVLLTEEEKGGLTKWFIEHTPKK